MSYELKDVYSTIGTPTFETKEKLDRAKALAAVNPYSMRWDHLEEYRSCYGDDAVNLLDKSRTDQSNGFLVVSAKKEWAFPAALWIPGDPIPQRVPGPDEEFIPLLWGGGIIRKKAEKPGGLTTADVEQIAARVTKSILKALDLIVE